MEQEAQTNISNDDKNADKDKVWLNYDVERQWNHQTIAHLTFINWRILIPQYIKILQYILVWSNDILLTR